MHFRKQNYMLERVCCLSEKLQRNDQPRHKHTLQSKLIKLDQVTSFRVLCIQGNKYGLVRNSSAYHGNNIFLHVLQQPYLKAYWSNCEY